MSSPAEQERLATLLSDEVVFGLAPEERSELDQLTGELNAEDQATAYETVAAAYYLAAATIDTESMPPTLRSSVMASLKQAAESQDSGVETPSATSRPGSPTEPSTTRWFAAIAASLLLGYLLGQPWEGSDNNATSPAAKTSPAAQLAALVDADSSVTRVAWAATEDPAAEGASGEVVWSDEEQRGFMVFRGLAANDPAKEQYQLWIFDAERDNRYPVDGGVFDIEAGEEEVITPINAKIAVDKAVMFAVTVEPPGGVVVSDRSRLPLLAKVD